MPTVLREGPYRFFFYSQDVLMGEPPPVHVGRDRNVAKFWLDPVRLERSGGFARHELRDIMQIIEDHEQELIDAWNDFAS